MNARSHGTWLIRGGLAIIAFDIGAMFLALYCLDYFGAVLMAGFAFWAAVITQKVWKTRENLKRLLGD